MAAVVQSIFVGKRKRPVGGVKKSKHTMSLKQGTVMEHSKLGFPVRGDGTIDDQERAIVEEIGVWMKLNSESIMLHVLGRNLEKDLLWKM